eukprot:TRINITY_DN87218_c0_g1_i1.p1 TRINITY_DN87218_c0_g1~~TRINITY_DN87218_c0_g1_i1.p1  ORF type:complete len:262 (+),score=71.34 TRINITY_DN87218_c0_g1_i1:120-905(+)
MPSFSFEVEYAKSGRAACKKCKAKIDKDLVRVGFKAEVPEDAEGAAAHMGCSWHHFSCFPEAKGKAWFKKHLTTEAESAVAGLEALKEEDRTLVAELFKACRGEVAVPAAPAVATAAADASAPSSKTNKRKSKGDDTADSAKAAKVAVEPVLTEKQVAAIAEAKAKLSSKNAAWLGAILAKNGLPKTGRKDELVERAAENQVLGVPPTCDVCEKKKLNFSKQTGKFSCPGFFDDDSKSFKKCKGPSADADLKRTPWEEMGA